MNDKSVSSSKPSSYAFDVRKVDGEARRRILVHAGNVAIAQAKAVRYVGDDEILCPDPIGVGELTGAGR